MLKDESQRQKYYLADWSETHLFFQELSELNGNSKPGPTYFSAYLARGTNDLEGDINTEDLIIVGSIVRLTAQTRRGSRGSGGGENFVLATIRKEEGLSSHYILAG